jgi:hypothetical protein
MKKTLILLLIITVATGCSSTKDHEPGDSAKDAATDNTQTQLLIKKFKPIVHGYWIRKDYIEKIMQTRSVLAASDLVGAAEIEINTDEIEGDSLNVRVGDNHETGNSTLKFIRGKKTSTLVFNGQDLSYSTKNGNTTLRLAFGDDTQKGFVFYTYIRAYKKLDKDFADMLEEYLGNVLVAGDYRLIDSVKSTQKVHFDKHGIVNGFIDLDRYFINYDLNSDVNDNLDAIYFKGPNKKQMDFAFKISADTLKLYDTRENADSTSLLIGDLKYQFVRQH